MSKRLPIIPQPMQRLAERAGYLPALRAGSFVFCAGQVGRDPALTVIADPEAQFTACWENLRLVLAEAGCGFADVVDMTTFHVDLSEHFAIFRTVKDRMFPRGTCPWTVIGVSELARPGLLVEVKCTAMVPARPRGTLARALRRLGGAGWGAQSTAISPR